MIKKVVEGLISPSKLAIGGANEATTTTTTTDDDALYDTCEERQRQV